MKNRNYIMTIVVLIIINIVALLLLWMGKPKHTIGDNENVIGNKVQIQEMLKEELDFSSEQVEQFVELRENHREKLDKIDEELMVLKKELFEDAMYSKNESISDSLLNQALEKQGELEKITFDHFLKLKQMCNPQQQEKLFQLMHQLIGPPQRDGRFRGGAPGKLMDDVPPPPEGGRPKGPHPRGERPPKRD
jgi:hypothetical protein